MKALMQAVFVGLVLTGYVMNIYKFTQCDFKASYKCEVMHGIGMVTPLGPVFGYFDFRE